MTEQPRKLLSLKTRTASDATENAPQTVRCGKKRIIKRDDLATSKLATTKKPPPKAQQKKTRPVAPKALTTPPSEIRMENLNASLNGYAVWSEYKPLALSAEKQVFQNIARHSLITQRLLKLHTRDQRYLRAVQFGDTRFNLDGSEAETITAADKGYASQAKAL